MGGGEPINRPATDSEKENYKKTSYVYFYRKEKQQEVEDPEDAEWEDIEGADKLPVVKTPSKSTPQRVSVIKKTPSILKTPTSQLRDTAEVVVTPEMQIMKRREGASDTMFVPRQLNFQVWS